MQYQMTSFSGHLILPAGVPVGPVVVSVLVSVRLPAAADRGLEVVQHVVKLVIPGCVTETVPHLDVRSRIWKIQHRYLTVEGTNVINDH